MPGFYKTDLGKHGYEPSSIEQVCVAPNYRDTVVDKDTLGFGRGCLATSTFGSIDRIHRSFRGIENPMR